MVEPIEGPSMALSDHSRVIIMTGEHGTGKSSIGTLLLKEGHTNDNGFIISAATKDCTKKCELKETEYNNIKYSIVDAPGLNFKLKKAADKEKIKEEIMSYLVNIEKPQVDATFVVTRCGQRDDFPNIKEELVDIYGREILKTISIIRNGYDKYQYEEEYEDIMFEDENLIHESFPDCPIIYTCANPRALKRILKDPKFGGFLIRDQIIELFKRAEENARSGNVCEIKEVKEWRERLFTLMETHIQEIFDKRCDNENIETFKIPFHLSFVVTKKKGINVIKVIAISVMFSLDAPIAFLVGGLLALTGITYVKTEQAQHKLDLNHSDDQVLMLYNRIAHLLIQSRDKFLNLKVEHRTEDTCNIVIERKEVPGSKLFNGIEIMARQLLSSDEYYEVKDRKRCMIKIDVKIPEGENSVEITKDFTLAIGVKLPNPQVMATEWAERKKKI